MRRQLSGLIVGGLLVLAAQTGCAPPSSAPPSALGLSVGDEAPEVISHDLNGKEVRLSSLRGKVVVLDVWATWCGYCRDMIPYEKRMVERLKDKPFVLVGISVDQERTDVAEFVAREKLPWTHWWDGPEHGIAEKWGIDGFPTTYVLDAKGVIRYEEDGFEEWRFEQLESTVNALLKEMDEKKP